MKKEKHTLTTVADEICRPVVRVCCFYTAGRDVYKQTYVTGAGFLYMNGKTRQRRRRKPFLFYRDFFRRRARWESFCKRLKTTHYIYNKGAATRIPIHSPVCRHLPIVAMTIYGHVRRSPPLT